MVLAAAIAAMRLATMRLAADNADSCGLAAQRFTALGGHAGNHAAQRHTALNGLTGGYAAGCITALVAPLAIAAWPRLRPCIGCGVSSHRTVDGPSWIILILPCCDWDAGEYAAAYLLLYRYTLCLLTLY